MTARGSLKSSRISSQEAKWALVECLVNKLVAFSTKEGTAATALPHSLRIFVLCHFNEAARARAKVWNMLEDVGVADLHHRSPDVQGSQKEETARRTVDRNDEHFHAALRAG